MTTPQDNLISILRTRREYCRAMLELARHQQTLIAEDRNNELIQLIAKKQRVLEGLTSLAQKFGGLVDHWKSVRDSLSSQDRTECDGIIAESEALLAETLQQESLGTEVLNLRRDRTRRELQELGELSQATAGQGNGAGPPEPQFLDVSR